MGTFLAYSVQAAVIMTLLYLGYKWLMASATFHRLNRWTLLLILALSWTLPAIVPMFRPRPVMDVQLDFAIPSDIVTETVAEMPAEPAVTWPMAVCGIYLAGMVVMLAVTAAGAWRMARIIRGGSHSTEGRYNVVVNKAAPGPFSWGRWIVIRPEDCDESRPMVIAHEEAHLNRLHWIDLIVAQLNVVLQWFSPAAWLLMHEIKTVHEFQADAAAGGDTPHDYQLMLLKKTVGASFPTFADSLTHSQIKQRLTMMMKSKSSRARRLSALAIPAMAVVAVFTLSLPSVADVINQIDATPLPGVSFGKVNNSAPDDQTVQESIVTDLADNAIPNPDPMAESKPTTATADNNVTEEPTSSVLIVGKDTPADKSDGAAFFVNGKLTSRAEVAAIPPADIKKMEIVKDDPAYPDGKIMITVLNADEKTHFTSEKIAEFKGGEKALMQFLAANLKYPKDAVPAGESTVVSYNDDGSKTVSRKTMAVISFKIGKDGSLSDFKVVRSAGEAFDAEALRVVKMTDGMWIPGENNGKPVATRFTIPVSFATQQ